MTDYRCEDGIPLPLDVVDLVLIVLILVSAGRLL